MDNRDPRYNDPYNDNTLLNDTDIANQSVYGEYNEYPTYDGTAPGRGKANAALVLGVISVIMAWMGWFSLLGVVLAIIGIGLSASARRNTLYSTSSRATAGLVLCIIAIIISVAAFFFSLFFWGGYGGYWDYYNYYWY